MHYKLTVRKSFGAAQRGSTWANTYVLNTSETIGSPAMRTLVEAVVNFEKGFHQTATQFISATVTAMEGSLFNTPQGTRTFPLGGNGSRVSADVTAEDGVFHKEMVMFVRFVTNEGESGSKAYRGALAEDFVRWQSGVGTINQVIQDAVMNGWTSLSVALGDSKLAVEHKQDGERVSFSDVDSVVVQGVRSRQTTRRKKKAKPTDDENQLISFLKDNALNIGITLGSLILTRGRVGKTGIAAKAPQMEPELDYMKRTVQEMEDIIAQAKTPATPVAQ